VRGLPDKAWNYLLDLLTDVIMRICITRQRLIITTGSGGAECLTDRGGPAGASVIIRNNFALPATPGSVSARGA
jgi:hypothetical protein